MTVVKLLDDPKFLQGLADRAFGYRDPLNFEFIPLEPQDVASLDAPENGALQESGDQSEEPISEGLAACLRDDGPLNFIFK